ncbi:MAG TPA: magnesium transporter, partial [Gammaproteobacteria bacterium]|nr:magnesium transporter [Gammaproteobacteria bacterium]
MQNTGDKEKHQKRLRSFTQALEGGTLASVRMMLNSLHPAEIAHVLESLPAYEREMLWELVDEKVGGDVLLHLNDEVRASLIREMETSELVAAAEGLETDDLADFLTDLPDVVIHEVLQSMDEQDRHRLESVLHYPEDTAGGLMNTDTITVRPDVTLDVVLRYLRLRGELPEMTDNLFVVNREDRYLGKLPLTALLTQPDNLTVSQVMVTDDEPILATMSASDVATQFEHHDL